MSSRTVNPVTTNPNFTPKLNKGQLVRCLGSRTAGNINPKRTKVMLVLKKYGQSSKDPGWSYLGSLQVNQIGILTGTHIETVTGALLKLRQGGAKRDRVTTVSSTPVPTTRKPRTTRT